MECREIIFDENVLSYIIGNYISEEYLTDLYEPDCFIPFDANQAVVFHRVDSVESSEIERFGFSAIPNAFLSVRLSLSIKELCSLKSKSWLS